MDDLKLVRKTISENQKLLLNEIKLLNEKVDHLNLRLSKHISFIESVYNPLSNSIERFKKFFK
jgi:hypothetical protein